MSILNFFNGKLFGFTALLEYKIFVNGEHSVTFFLSKS